MDGRVGWLTHLVYFSHSSGELCVLLRDRILNRLFDRSRLIGSAVSAGLFLVFAWMLERLSMLVYDDAFIHLRIARNLALTGRAFWNPGERVMATSSPAWTILLAVSGMWKHRELLPWFEAFLLT